MLETRCFGALRSEVSGSVTSVTAFCMVDGFGGLEHR